MPHGLLALASVRYELWHDRIRNSCGTRCSVSAGMCRRIVKLVRAMRKGWLKRQDEQPPEKPPVYLLWQDDGMAADHTQAGEPQSTIYMPIGAPSQSYI